MTTRNKLDTMANVTARAQSDISITVGVKYNSRTKPGVLANAQAPSPINPSATTKLHIRMHLDSGQAQ